MIKCSGWNKWWSLMKVLALIAAVCDTTLSTLWALPPAGDYVRDFHQRLRAQEPEWFKDPDIVRAYYTVVENPILSEPLLRVGGWDVSDVRFAGEPMTRLPDGSYEMRILSFKIPTLTLPERFPENFSVNTTSAIVKRRGQERSISFQPTNLCRMPVLKGFDNFKGFFEDAGYWAWVVTWKGILPPDDEHDEGGEFTFKSRYSKPYPIRLRGMAVTYQNNIHKTRLFFDFSGTEDGDFTKIFSKEIPQSKRSAPESPQTVYQVIDHKLHAFKTKDITYGIFDSHGTQSAWVPAQGQFYSLNGEIIPFLPNFYSISVEGGMPDPSIAWVFRDDDYKDVFYKDLKQEKPLESNCHIYSDGVGSLFLTDRRAREFMLHCPDGRNTNVQQHFECLYVVPKMYLSLDPDQLVEGGHRIWNFGVYRRTVRTPWVEWRQEGTGGVEIITDNGRADPNGFRLTYDASSSADESYVQCDAMQRSWWSSFPATVFRANKRLLAGLNTWKKLTNLNMGSLNLESVDWKNVLEAIGTMNQLTTFQFTNNSLILNFNDDYDQLAGRVADYHVQLGECLVKLTRLKELQIQGLWLRPRSKLGEIGAGNKENVSKEVAMTTGIINHNNRKGISKILESLCGLPMLETLSMDGIPDHGSSYFSRRDGLTQALLFPWWIVTSLAAAVDGETQCKELKKLAIKAAEDLAQRPALKKVIIYSPKDDCFDYFSKFFWEQLKAKKPSLTGERCVL